MFVSAALPSDEAARLAALRGLNILDTPPEPAFDSLARLAAHACHTPIALVSLVDENRQWFKAHFGLDVMETPRDSAFCAHAILQDPMLEVCDARADERFADNPLVIGAPAIRFYAGVPLRTRDGHALGTLCVIDFVPRRLDEEQRWILRTLAEQACAQIELRRSALEAADVLRVLEDERMLLRSVLHAATEYAVIGTTRDGTINLFNRGSERLFGYHAEEVIDRATPELFVDAADLAARAAALGIAPGFEALAKLARRSEGDWCECTCIRKGGERFPAAVTVTAKRTASSEITGFICVARDLTKERAAERERQRLADEQTARAAANRSVARLARLHDVAVALAPVMSSREVFDILVDKASASVDAQSAALMVFKNDDTRLELVAARGFSDDAIRALRAVSSTTGLPIVDALREGRSIFLEKVPGDACYREYADLRRIHGGQSAIAIPLLADGRSIGGVCLGFAAPRTFDDEDRMFILALGRLGAQAIDRARAYEAEATARRAADAANDAKDQFIAILSHELRTPLTAVLGWAQILQKAPPDPARLARGLAVIEKNGAALLRFVEAIFEVNHIVAGNVTLSCGLVELGAVVRDAIEAMKPVAEAEGLTLTLTVAPGVSIITADPDRLAQIVANLLSNAVKFTPRGGRIDVTVDHVGDQARLSVCDTGEGIAPEFLPHLFERFVQADSSRTRLHGGLGLGLAIVKHLVELHGGTITATSAGRGQGAELTVLLPRNVPIARGPLRSSSSSRGEEGAP
jgi:PAS domain S-box-containing protein